MNKYREMIVEGIKKRHPDCKVTIEYIKGNNGTGDAGFLVRLNDTQCFPVIPCERFEILLQEGECSLEEILDEVDIIIEDRVDLDASYFTDYEKIKSKIYIRLINKEQNTELLEYAPYREFLDLAITYRIGPIHTCKVEGNALVTNSIFQAWGITEEELYEVAYENSFKELPEIMSMAKLMRRILADDGNELASLLQDTVSSKDIMYVCGYKSIAGAACMINHFLFQKFSGEMENDLLILPSSIYEVIIVPMKEEYSTEAFVQMVETVNQTHVAANEVLSNHVYKYDRELSKVIDLCEVHY